MKTLITVSILLLFISFTGFAQIKFGLPKGTPDGSAILDLSNTGASSTTKKGFLGPQVALSGTADATTVPTPATGLMVYNTTAAGSGSTAVVAGYYYYNGTQWVQMVSSAAPASGNIYTADGTLTSARTLSSGGFKLNLNTKVGLGTSTPASQLEIPLSTPISSLTVDSSYIMLGQPAAVHTLFDFSSIQTKTNANTAGNLLLNPLGGNVGIGTTTTPGAKLEIAGTGSTFSAAAILNNTTATTGRKFSIASRTDITNGAGQNGLFAIADESASLVRLVIDQAGAVGIGTAAPATKLEIKGGGSAFPATSGTTQSAGLIARLRDGSANGFLEIGGNATSGSWLQATDATNLATTYPILLNPIGGNVGIGTTTPHAPLQLANATANRRIVMYESFNNDHQFYGLGINNSMLRYQIDNTGATHAFFAGTSTTTSNELMRIQGSGNVGIGTTTPAALLELAGNATFGFPGVIIGNTSANGRRFSIGSRTDITSGTGKNGMFVVGDEDAVAYRIIMDQNGNVGINQTVPTFKLDVNGTIRGSTSVTSPSFLTASDARLKTNIVPIANALSSVMKFTPVDYNKKESIGDANYNIKEMGFLAQDVRKIFPELVSEAKDANKTLAVNYTAIIPLLTKAIQEQQAQIIELKNANIAMAKQNAIIAAQLIDIKEMKITMAAMQSELIKIVTVQVAASNIATR